MSKLVLSCVVPISLVTIVAIEFVFTLAYLYELMNSHVSSLVSRVGVRGGALLRSGGISGRAVEWMRRPWDSARGGAARGGTGHCVHEYCA